MGKQYLGTLAISDPLYEILASSICTDVKDPMFHVTRTSSRMVYKYTEEKSLIALIGKFYLPDDSHYEKICRVKGEFDALQRIRAYGFDTSPYYVVKPIHKSERIGLALIEEYVHGRDLDYYFKKAVYEGKADLLKNILGKLALFLSMLHRKTETSERVDSNEVGFYFLRIIDKLWRQKVISDDQKRSYTRLMERWLYCGMLERARKVIIHGDATPTNFIFSNRGDIVAIDLERSKTGDPAFDVSMVCGEIKHAFLWRTGNPYASEPFIRHFLKSYACNFPHPQETFRDITMRNPFYMGLTELRIARNTYLDWHYRQRLAFEAKECLKWGLKLH